MDLRMWLAGEKQYFTRGSSYVNIIISILVITANIKLFEGFIIPLLPGWFSVQWLYLIAVVGYPICSRMIGYFDLKQGIWSHENNWMYFASPWSNEILINCRMIPEMKKDIEELKRLK